jgi:murein DD-endopeptidase MepM/ murein hydrolase activator NlpD
MLGPRSIKPSAAAAICASALSVVTLSGSNLAAHADRAADYRVLPGTVLRPLPPSRVLPVHGYRLTGRFGDVSGLWHSIHTGLDFAAPSGTPIRSLATGVVTAVGFDGRYGNKTVVTLADGTEVWYCHQSETDVVRGQWLRPGELLGKVGSTGNVTGPHLHLEIRPAPDRPVDPGAWLRHRGLRP